MLFEKGVTYIYTMALASERRFPEGRGITQSDGSYQYVIDLNFVRTVKLQFFLFIYGKSVLLTLPFPMNTNVFPPSHS